MKITPLDIRRKEFKRSMRGYSDEEVDIFLDQVADEFERIFQENMELQDRLNRLDEQIAGHAQLRDALEKTLVSAQLQAEELRTNARKESELILRDAELKARGIVSASYGETQKTQQALVQLKLLEEDFRIKFRSLLEGYLRLVNEAPLAVAASEPASLDAGDASHEPESEPVVALSGGSAAPFATEAAAVTGAASVAEVASATEPHSQPEVRWAAEAAPEPEAAEAVLPAPTPAAPAPAPPAPAPPIPPATVPRSPATTPEQSLFRPVPPPTPEATSAMGRGQGAIVDPGQSAAAGPAAASSAAFEERWPVGGFDDTATEEIPTAEAEAALDGAPAESDLGMDAPASDATEETDLLRGFFFGRHVDDVDDTFPGANDIKKDKTRDFEW